MPFRLFDQLANSIGGGEWLVQHAGEERMQDLPVLAQQFVMFLPAAWQWSDDARRKLASRRVPEVKHAYRIFATPA